MTLEDFFTLTEMKDGFTAPARVEELVTVMQKEKNSVVKSIGDSTRQWAAVASTIAATENKECLDLFIQLDGLLFIDRWLKDAQTFPDEASDCFVEEAISALLQAVEKLQVDGDKLTSSGLCITVKSLLSYKSIKVQDRARALFDSWKAKDVDFTSMDVDFTSTDAEKAPDNNDLKLDCQDPESQCTAKDVSPTRSSNDQKLEGSGMVENKLSNDLDRSQKTSNNADSNDGCADMVVSPAKLESIAEDPVKEEVCPSDRVLDFECVTSPKQATKGVISECLKPESLVEDAKHDNQVDMLPDTDRLGNIVVTSASVVSDSKDVTRTDAKAVEEIAENIKDESLMKTTSACDTNNPVKVSSDGMDDSEQIGLEKGEGSALEKSKDQGATISAIEDDEHNELNRYHKSERRFLGSSCEFTRSTKNSKTTDIIRQTQDMDLEDGTVDALEVARLVAKEVEQEVVGYYEQSGSSASSSSSSSSSDTLSRGGVGQHDSPKSINREQGLEVDGPVNQLSATENAPDASAKAPSKTAADLATVTKNHTQDLESSLITDAAREPESNAEKSFWEFDLNQEFSSEDANHQVDTSSNPISVISAPRAVVGLGMPAGPLQFEGSLGWKGSAATSAFRPASPRRASDSDKALSGGATSSGSRQKQDFLDFDLNVTEGGGDDKIVIPVLSKQKQMLSSLRSDESSVELSPKKSQGLKLDLNQTEDDGVLPTSEWKMGLQLIRPQNSHRSPSPASSSSCLQSSMRNFDLNDNPSNCTDLSDQPTFLRESSQKANLCMGPPDDTVISIMGTKVKKNTFPPQTPLPFLNGKASEPVMDANLFRGGPLMGLGPAVPYPQSVFGYNGLAMGPTVSLTSAQIYRPGGPIPCVFDSRGTPFLPQMLGSASTVPPSYCQSSLVMNMMGATPGPNLTGPLRPNLDLNSGFANAGEAGNPEPAFFRPLFIPHGQGRPSEEQLRDGFRAMGSGSSGGKRKEPDSGWEFYPTNYKHQ
ncbi:Urease subunit alpha [Bienertia sinuspersici]